LKFPSSSGGPPPRKARRVGGQDSFIIATNDDAAVSKLSCVKLGYYADQFLSFFVAPPAERRSPLINLGYYSRVAALRKLMRMFIESGTNNIKKQIVSLGAGFDTTFFHFKDTGILGDNVVYYEVDLKEVVDNKIKKIVHTPALSKIIQLDQIQTSDGQLLSPLYNLVAADLRNVENLTNALHSANFDESSPTLFLSECVLIYLEPEESENIIKWAGSLNEAMFVTYEQILPNDRFGQMMIKNLNSRHIELKGLRAHPDLPSQEKVYVDSGWNDVVAKDMNKVYTEFLSPQERSKAARIEILDEMEEWQLIQAHYCIVCAKKYSPDAPSFLHNVHFFQEKKK